MRRDYKDTQCYYYVNRQCGVVWRPDLNLLSDGPIWADVDQSEYQVSMGSLVFLDKFTGYLLFAHSLFMAIHRCHTKSIPTLVGSHLSGYPGDGDAS